MVNEWGVPAAVVELGDRPCIRDLDTDQTGEAHFVEDGVGYYPHVMSSQLPMLLNGAYSYLMMDLGSAQSEWQEFLRCDLRYLVALLTVTGNIYEKKRFQQIYHVPVRSVPFIADPFRLEKDQLAFFQELL